MRTSLAALICCLLVATLAGATVVAGAPSTVDPGPGDTGEPAAAAVDATSFDAGEASTHGEIRTNDGLQSDEVNQSRPETIEIRIDADGDAHFVLAKEFPAGTDAEQRAFERVAREFEQGQHGDLGFAAYEAAFGDVDEESDREMELIDDGRHTSQEDDVGRLEYRFTWTNFATVEAETVAIGDAFTANENVWLELYEDQRLLISAPDGYGVAASPSGPEIESDTLIWTGPASFAPGDLDVTFDATAGESSSSFLRTLLLGLGVVVFLVALLAAAWRFSDGRSGEEPILDRPIRESLTDAIASIGSGVGDAAPRSSGDGPNGPRNDTAATGEKSGAANDAEPSAAPEPAAAASETVDPELLSDEERVEHLLDENGGRMKQANIVTETGWSNAKVSQLLSRMAEEDRVDKLRIGRENLITLPDVDVTDQGEPDS